MRHSRPVPRICGRTIGSNLPDLGRVDLNRQPTDYPNPPAPGRPFNAAQTQQVNQAQKDRVLMAYDMFVRFVAATGAVPPNQLDQGGANNIGPNDPRFQATRYLAQLAVNIVDYIDDDDYITAFNWLSTANSCKV